MEYEFKKKMSKAEVVDLLKRLAQEIEEGSDITSPDGKKLPIRRPIFEVEYEYKERSYGKKLEIGIEMKEYE